MSKKSMSGETSRLLMRGEERMKLKRELQVEENNNKKQKNGKEPQGNLVAVPYLPENCIFNITARLPLESLPAARFVCKSWYGIIKNPAFIDAHMQCSNTGLIYLTPVVKSRMASGSSAKKVDFNVDAKVLELDSNPVLNRHTLFHIKYLEIKDGQSIIKEYNMTFSCYIRTVCNGLIVLQNPVKERGLIIMNPVTRELKKIPLGTRSRPLLESYGLAFCHESGTYKLVHLFKDDSKLIGCEIMDIGSDKWRVVDGPPDGCISRSGYRPVFAIGALHWVPRLLQNEYIVSMALIDEKFQKIPLPKIGGNRDRILEMGGSLGFVRPGSGNIIEVWMLKSLIGEGWAKQHSITVGCMGYMIPFYCERDGGELVFMNADESRLYAYDQHLQLMRKIEVNKEWCSSLACHFPHVNTLVDPKSGNH